jgi:hypothetical protein
LILGALDAARRLDAFAPLEIADAIARLHASGYKRETIRKSITHLACVFDFAEIEPNPVRDKLRVRLPRGEIREAEPPNAEHVEAVYRLLPPKHRLALLWLDWSGARVSSIDTTLVGDYDEPRRRVRLRAAASKTGRALWVDLPYVPAEAIERTLPPREDRNPRARLLASSGADAIRTSIAKACQAAGVPLWSPHDLPPSPDQPSPPAGTHLGRDRRARRPAVAQGDERHLHPRARRRPGARLRGAARATLTAPATGRGRTPRRDSAERR